MKNKIMKIALVLDGLQVGGIERVCIDYCKILTSLNYEITIFNLRPELKALKKEVPSSVHIVDIPFSTYLAPEKYAKLIKKDFLGKFIYFFAYIFFSILVFFYKLYCKIRYRECRNRYDFLIAFSSHFNDLTFVSKKFAETKHTIAWVHGALYSYLLLSDGYVNLYNKIKNLIVLVDDAQEEVLAYNKNLHLTIYKLYNPTSVNLRKIDNEKVREIQKKYGDFFLMVSRFQYPHKDQPTVIKAFANLIVKYKVKINLVFIGDGPDKKKSEQIVKRLPAGVKKRIYFLGTELDVQDYYVAAYALVHASVAGEGLPTVMIEAMNYGLPEIVTDSKTGPREILGDSKYGLLCKVNDPEDMSVKMYELVKNKALYHNLQNLEHERITDFYPQKIKEKLNNILMKISDEQK